jgi:hypothetical protein
MGIAWTSQRAGSWTVLSGNAASPWHDGGPQTAANTYPGAGTNPGDTVAQNHTIDIPDGAALDLGTSPAAGGTAALTIANGVKLTSTPTTGLTLKFRGDVVSAQTSTTRVAGFYAIDLQGVGVVVEWDSSLAPTPATDKYVFRPSGSNQPNSRVRIVAQANPGDPAGKMTTTTGGNHAVVRSNAGGGNARFSLGGFNSRLGSCYLRYVDFERFGDASNPWADLYLSGSGVEPDTFDVAYCSFTDCGNLASAVAVAAAAVFSVVRCRWSGTVSTTCTTVSANTAMTTGTRLFQECAFDKLFGSSTNMCGFTVRRCVIDGSWSLAAHATIPWASVEDCFVRKSVAGAGGSQIGGATAVGGPVTRCYYLTDKSDGTNCKWWGSGTPSYDVTFSGGHWETTSTLDTTGDFLSISTAPAALRTFTVERHTCGFTVGTQERPGTLVSVATSGANNRLSVAHNTWIAGDEPTISVGETASTPAGVVTAFEDNLTYAPLTPQGDNQLHARDIAATGVNADVFTPAGIRNNAAYGTLAGSAGRGFDLTLTTPPDATNLTGVDPQFVDTSRNLAAWDLSLGGAGTLAAARARLAADPSLVPTAYSWVRAGWAPTNSTLRGVASDGTTPGAVEGRWRSRRKRITISGVI